MEPASDSGALDLLFSQHPTSQSLHDTYGAILIATFVTLSLYGLMVYQTSRYVCLYSADALILRVIVFGLLATGTLHCRLLIHICYHYLITVHFNSAALLVNIWSLQIMPLVTGTILILSQSFYLRRVYLGIVHPIYRPLITATVASFMLLELGGVAAGTAASLLTRFFSGTSNLFRPLISIGLGVDIAVDCSLTGALVAILRQRRTAFQRTNVLLDKLVLYAAIATVMTTAATIPVLVFVLIQPHSFIWIALVMPATKVYSNSVLAMLNCRADLRASKEDRAMLCVSEDADIKGADLCAPESSGP
ncbi:hypothetical protein C8Q74DRAFT_1279987 [Fomes fomentarius]|nr:hypothetical protein C8Q74DRAFT_1279987 [Fomes fomentarius]